MTEELEQVLDRLMERVIVEIGKEERKSIKEPFTLATLKRLFQGVRDPKPEQPNYIPLAALPVIPPEFPKLKVLYDGKLERGGWTICADGEAVCRTTREVGIPGRWSSSRVSRPQIFPSVLPKNTSEENNWQKKGGSKLCPRRNR